MRFGVAVVVASIVGSVALVAGCGGSSGPTTTASTSHAPTTAPRSTATSGNGAGVDPNAREAPVAGDIPDSQVFVQFQGTGYSIEVPEGWARLAGAATTFSDHYNSIRLETLPAGTEPTAASVTATDVPQLRSSTPAFTLGSVSMVTRRSGPAVLMTYEANSAPDPVTAKRVRIAVERYEFWRNGTVAVVTLAGAKGSDNVDPWRKVTDSFAWRS